MEGEDGQGDKLSQIHGGSKWGRREGGVTDGLFDSDLHGGRFNQIDTKWDKSGTLR